MHGRNQVGDGSVIPLSFNEDTFAGEYGVRAASVLPVVALHRHAPIDLAKLRVRCFRFFVGEGTEHASNRCERAGSTDVAQTYADAGLAFRIERVGADDGKSTRAGAGCRGSLL